mgnify:FL=1|jgi:DnaJ-class molecular chaperone
MSIPFEVIMNPYAHGYIECDHCNGYGSSLKDPPGQNTCSKCGGYGIVKAKGNRKTK